MIEVLNQISPTMRPVALSPLPHSTVLLASTSAAVAPSGGAFGTQSGLGNIVGVFRMDRRVWSEFRAAEGHNVCRVFTRSSH